MLKVDVNKEKDLMEIGFGGSFPDIISELGTLVHVLHIRLCKRDLFLGLEFEKTMKNPEFWELVLRAREGDAEIFKKGDGENG